MKFSARFEARRGAHQALAQNVLFGDQRDVGGLEAGFDAEHGEAGLIFGSASACGHDATGVRLSKPVLGEHMRHASREPSLHSATMTRLPAACSPPTCFFTASKTLALAAALGGEIVAGVSADVDDVAAAFRRCERRQARQRG